MALTQRTGALALAGQQAASIANSIAQLAQAANLHYTGGGSQGSFTPAPSGSAASHYIPPAPVYSNPLPRYSGGSAAAAQQIVNRAVENRSRQMVQQNVLANAGKTALQAALAATGAAPSRQVRTQATMPLQRLATNPAQHLLTPEQESQLFDQQIQITKQQADPIAWMDPTWSARAESQMAQMERVRSGFQNAQPNPRLTQEQGVLSAFPQMTPQELRTRSNPQLQALIDLANRPPAAPSQAGVGEQPTPGNPPAGEMTRGSNPGWEFHDIGGPSVQYGNQQVGFTDERGPAQFYGPQGNPFGPSSALYGVPSSGPLQVAQAFAEAMQPRGVQALPEVGSGNTDDGGGSFFGNVIGAAKDAWGDFNSPYGPLGTLFYGGKAIWDQLDDTQVGDITRDLLDATAGGYEAFLESGPGKLFAEAMAQLNRPLEWNQGNVGGLAYRTATKDPIYSPVQVVQNWGDLDETYISLFPPLAIAFEAAYEADPNLQSQVILWHDQGYSSPDYIRTAEAAGLTVGVDIQPQFTGDRAIWEGLIGMTDSLPPVLKYPIRLLGDTLLDPLNTLAAVAGAGARVSQIGRALSSAEDASLLMRAGGKGAELAGKTTELAARAPDLPVEMVIKGGKFGGKKVGEVTGLFSPSTAGLRRDAAEDVTRAAEALTVAREGVADVEARVAFDAEAQGVAPTMGPELIGPVAGEAPTDTGARPVTVTRQVDGEDIVSRGTTTSTIERPVETVASRTTSTVYPTFESLPTAPRSSAANPSKVYDYNGTRVVIREVTSADGAPYFVAHLPRETAVRNMVTADSYVDLMDKLPSVLGGEHPPIPTVREGAPKRGGTPPKSERVSPRSLSEARDLENYLRAEGADEETIHGAVQDFLSTRFADERDAAAATGKPKRGAGTPPTTPVEKQAAAAANRVPDRPRNTGELNMAAAVEHSKATGGKKIPSVDGTAYPRLNKARVRAQRLAKEEREGLPKEVSKILEKQTPGEHEFSPIVNGHRPLDRIVTDAIKSKDPEKLKAAEALVKQVDDAVEQHLRTDPFYQTWKKGGATVFLQDDPRFTDDFFEAMRVLDPEGDPARMRILANGLAKGVLDDIGLLQFQVNHLIPMIAKTAPEYMDLTGILGSAGRIESRDFRAESSAWLLREYLDTPDAARADTILKAFLANPDEVTVIADGLHRPYAHAIPTAHQTEALARLPQMREQWRQIKRQASRENWEGVPGAVQEVSDAPFRQPDRAAQLAGSARGREKGWGKQLRDAVEHSKHQVATDAQVEAAIGSIKDPEIRQLLLAGDARLTVELATHMDTAMPAGFVPAGWADAAIGPPKTDWNLKETISWYQERALADPTFDYQRHLVEAGELARGLEPKRTAAEMASMRKAAKAAGLDPKAVKDGTSLAERAAATKMVRAIDAYLRTLRNLLQFNPIIGMANRVGDVLGNMVTHGIRGDFGSTFKQFPLTFKATHDYRSLARDPGALTAAWSSDAAHMAETGMGYSPRLFDGVTKISEVDPAKLPQLQQWLTNRNAGRGLTTVTSVWTLPALKDVTAAGEMIGRKLAFDSIYTDTIRRESFPAFMAYLEKAFPGQSDRILKDIYTSASEKGGRSWTGYFSYEDVKKATGNEQAARVWQRELNRAEEKGIAEAELRFFNGKRTNADEIASRVFTFHFWMTRATALYGRQVLRNPGLLNGFYKVYQTASEIGQEQGLPSYLQGMLKFYTGAGGMYAAMDPIGMLFPLFFMDLYSQEGNKLQAFQNLLNPIASGALGALGLTSNVPNAFGTRNFERFIIDMGNFLKGEGVPLESLPVIGQYLNQDSLQFTIPTEEITKKIIDGANNFLGHPFGDFKPFDRAANEHDQLYSMGEQIATGLFGDDMTKWSQDQWDQLDAAVRQAQYGDGEETWLSEAIRAQYGREGAARAGMALVIPGGVVTRQAFRDQQIEGSHDYWDSFYAGRPTTKAGASAAIGRQMATSAQPAWIAMNNEYYKIGTDEQQQVYGLYNDMLQAPENLNPKTSIVINNGNGSYTFYTMSDLAAMEYDDRFQILAAWADQTEGAAEAVKVVGDGRDAFKAAHPDYGQYSEYQKGVHAYDGGITQFRKDMADNPTFKAAEDEERARLKKEGKSGGVLEAELDKWAVSQAGFFAATGQKWKADDTVGGTPGPSSVMAMQNVKTEGAPKDDSKGGGSKGTTVKDPTVDDYWSPAKGVARLADDQAQYDYDNQKMEEDFGPYWNYEKGDWEDNADSASERKKLGITERYVLPGVSETMKRYEDWAEDHPGGTPEEFFEEMLKTEGFGKKTAPAKTASLPAGGVTYTPGVAVPVAGNPNSPRGKLATATAQLHVTNVPKTGSRPSEDAAGLELVKVAKQYVGQVPYVWGAIPGAGQDPTGGWDCSGMTYWLDQNYGSGKLPMGSHYQYDYAQRTGKLFTDLDELEPGDIVFIDTGWYGGAGGDQNPAGHVGIYAGNGKLINATNASQGTVIGPLESYGTILGAMHGSWTGA